MNTQNRFVYLLLLLLIVVAVFSVWSVASSVTLRKQFRPDTYKESIVQPEKAEYCPGEKLTYTYQIKSSTALGPAAIWDAWCRPDGLCDSRLTSVRYSVRAAPVMREVNTSVIVPALLPGEWRLVHATAFHADGYDMFSVPFVVPTSCGILPTTTP